MTKQEHLTSGLLVKAIDAELTNAEARVVKEHLERCGECRQKYNDFRRASVAIESGLAAIPVRTKLEARQTTRQINQTPERVMWRFGWGMAVAASLALGIVMMPKHKDKTNPVEIVQETATLTNAIEVGGETFVPLPYSNPDLPVNESRIVEMQVPVSALNDIGIVLEPVSSREARSDGSVLADVLMGTDGQPLGVHIRE
jgi:putative zinc finger protein